jgi:hypothetical protein
VFFLSCWISIRQSRHINSSLIGFLSIMVRKLVYRVGSMITLSLLLSVRIENVNLSLDISSLYIPWISSLVSSKSHSYMWFILLRIEIIVPLTGFIQKQKILIPLLFFPTYNRRHYSSHWFYSTEKSLIPLCDTISWGKWHYSSRLFYSEQKILIPLCGFIPEDRRRHSSRWFY